MAYKLTDIIDSNRYSLSSEDFRDFARRALDEQGALVLDGFLKPDVIAAIRREGELGQEYAFYTKSDHNIYLTPPDSRFAPDHPRNRLVASSKGCITDDQIPSDSALRILYEAAEFRDFLCSVLREDELFEYADSLSSINLHYADEGQELGWHFDNSSFAITLLIQEPEGGGQFDYVRDVRDADAGEMNFDQVGAILDGDVTPKALVMKPGALVLFRGRNSMHRVTPSVGKRTRMLVVLAYNTQPGVSLSESARIIFYGRLS